MYIFSPWHRTLNLRIKIHLSPYSCVFIFQFLYVHISLSLTAWLRVHTIIALYSSESLSISTRIYTPSPYTHFHTLPCRSNCLLYMPLSIPIPMYTWHFRHFAPSRNFVCQCIHFLTYAQSCQFTSMNKVKKSNVHIHVHVSIHIYIYIYLCIYIYIYINI